MILKRNLWNKIFHRKTLREQRSLYWRNKALVSNYPKIKEEIENSTNLLQLLAAHKQAWVYGFRNDNLGPCEFGMFRTKSIPDMTSDEVYLGNIYGLWTFPLSEWQNNRGSEDYNIVVFQYKNHLLSNVKSLMQVAKDYVYQYENLIKLCMKKYFKWIKTLIKKHKSNNYIVSFTKEFDGRWYVDFPGWPISHHNLMMVAGADDFLEYLDVKKINHVKLNVITSKTKRDPKKCEFEFVKQNSGLYTGATYLVNNAENGWDKDKTIWLCPVTLSVLGEYPDYMYVTELPYNY